MMKNGKTINGRIMHIHSKFIYSFVSDREFNLLIAAGFFSGIANGIHASIFNNFLNDVYHLSETARGLVEFPRELPGLLVLFVFAALSFLSITRLASFSMLLSTLGMLGLGFLSPDFTTVMIWMVVLNMGMHIYLPLAPGIGMHLSEEKKHGARLGRYSAYNLTAALIGYLIIWLGFQYLHVTYYVAFIIAACCYFTAGIFLYVMKPNIIENTKRKRFVFKKKFMLFYILSIVNGARKQIFLTFAPWVLIKIYHVDVPTYAIFGFIISAISIGTRTIVGKAIDKLGERIVLSAEAVLLFLLCMGYAFSADLFPFGVALVITAGCYILDNSLVSVEMARSTYVNKISNDPNEIIPTLSTGVSLDHAVSMTMPTFGGLIWAAFGFQYVFIFAALIAIINIILSLRIKIKTVNAPASPIIES